MPRWAVTFAVEANDQHEAEAQARAYITTPPYAPRHERVEFNVALVAPPGHVGELPDVPDATAPALRMRPCLGCGKRLVDDGWVRYCREECDDGIPFVTCSMCGHSAKCARVGDGTVYRPFAWRFEDDSLTGVCPGCYRDDPSEAVPADLWGTLRIRRELGTPEVKSIVERAGAVAALLPDRTVRDPWPESERRISAAVEPRHGADCECSFCKDAYGT
jgi:hypothetical protein